MGKPSNTQKLSIFNLKLNDDIGKHVKTQNQKKVGQFMDLLYTSILSRPTPGLVFDYSLVN